MKRFLAVIGLLGALSFAIAPAVAQDKPADKPAAEAPAAAAIRHSASAPVSPVRMRIACSRSDTKIFPSPIFPVFADFSIASMA
jgi:hypothetical protein